MKNDIILIRKDMNIKSDIIINILNISQYVIS
jgi:hypothetical protein